MAIRGTWVFRNGRMVEKGGPDDVIEPPKRSDLPMPYIAGDGQGYMQHMGTGRWTDSKSEMRRWNRETGLVEVGNDMMEPKAPERPKITKAEIAEALQKVKQGYKPAPLTDAPGIDAANDVVFGG